MPDTRLRSDALADDALAFLKPLVVGVWGAVAVGILAMPSARAASPSDLSPYGASCQHCIPIAETAK